MSVFNREMDRLKRELRSTREIYLSNFDIGECIPWRLLAESGVTHLNLMGYEMDSISDDIRLLKYTLVNLEIGGAFLSDLPDGFYELENLREFMLESNSEFLTISSQIVRLTNLLKLDISLTRQYDLYWINLLNGLKYLACFEVSYVSSDDFAFPFDFRFPSSLVELDANGCDLSKMGDNWLTEMTELETLDIGKSELQCIPGDLAKLKKLRKLNIANNPSIRELPYSLLELKNLEELDISDNNFYSWPSDFSSLTNLKYVKAIDVDPELQDALAGLPSVKYCETTRPVF